MRSLGLGASATGRLRMPRRTSPQARTACAAAPFAAQNRPSVRATATWHAVTSSHRAPTRTMRARAATLLVLGVALAAGSVVDLDAASLQAALGSGGPTFVKFYAPWCVAALAPHAASSQLHTPPRGAGAATASG